MPDETPEQWAARNRREQGLSASKGYSNVSRTQRRSPTWRRRSLRQARRRPDGRDPPTARSGTTA
jgi:hypothetical protein